MKQQLIRAFDDDFDIDAGSSHVEMSSVEKMTPGSLYEYWLEIYDQYKIWERWHISFDAYIDRPSFMMESLNQTAERLNKKDIEAAEKIKRQAEKERLSNKLRNKKK